MVEHFVFSQNKKGERKRKKEKETTLKQHSWALFIYTEKDSGDKMKFLSQKRGYFLQSIPEWNALIQKENCRFVFQKKKRKKEKKKGR